MNVSTYHCIKLVLKCKEVECGLLIGDSGSGCSYSCSYSCNSCGSCRVRYSICSRWENRLLKEADGNVMVSGND